MVAVLLLVVRPSTDVTDPALENAGAAVDNVEEITAVDVAATLLLSVPNCVALLLSLTVIFCRLSVRLLFVIGREFVW